MLGLYLALSLLDAAAQARPSTHDSHHYQQRESLSPCENLAAEQAVYFVNNPNDPIAVVPANVTYACLTSVPVQKDFSIQLVNNARAWFEFQSDIDYVASPPSGSLFKPLNLFAYLEDIADSLRQDKYKNQYDFELDLFTFSLHFRDAHTSIAPGLFFKLGSMAFDRNLSLVSYSSDGIEIPKVYLSEDVLLPRPIWLPQAGFELAPEHTRASPVVAINHLPVQEFLQTQALTVFSHDPDTMYNQLLDSIALTLHPQNNKLNYFKTSLFYPGIETVIEREDGSVLTRPTLSYLPCDLQGITSGYEFWKMCVFDLEEAAAGGSATEETATSTATMTNTEYARSEPTAELDSAETGNVQLRGHPEPEVIDIDNLLSGYFLEGYEDVAVIVIRGFLGGSSGFVESFQNTLESFLELAQAHKKTKLIIDFQGNSGGYVDASTDLLAQLFPNVPPDQKNNMRASLGMQLILGKEGRALDQIIQSGADPEDILVLEAHDIWGAWQAMMKPDASEFVSFEDFYGPNNQGKDGNYTEFFQANYTNSDPTELNQDRIQITGYGSRLIPPGTPPPFDASNIVVLTDGTCASACTIATEMLVNTHSTPTFVVGGRPSTGPMQAIGGTKGSVAWDSRVLSPWFLAWWEEQELEPISPSQIASTPFEYLESFGLTHGSIRLNGRNNYRIGDDTETPLQMVYSAADCRIWPTLDMITDQSNVWKQVADIAFDPSRKAPGAAGGPYTSKFCVKDSTGHSTTVTGGLKHGELGDQNPPRNAYSQYSGWLKDGKEVVQGLSLVRIDDDDSESAASAGSALPPNGQIKVGLPEMKTACNGYTGDKWLLTLLCNMFR